MEVKTNTCIHLYIKNIVWKHIEFLALENEGNSHIYLLKILTDLCTIKRFAKIKNMFLLKCMYGFSILDILRNQEKNCFENNCKEKIRMLEKISNIKFNRFGRQIKATCVIYANFESTLTNVKSKEHKANDSHTSKYQDKTACSDRYKLICIDGRYSKAEEDFYL